MTRIRDTDQDDTTSFVKLSRQKRTNAPKIDKSTADRLSQLESTNDRLSRSLLATTNFLKRVIHYAPPSLREEYEKLKSLSTTDEFEVHP